MQSKLGLELGLFQIGAGIKKYKKTDTMKVVAGNSTTRNKTPSDIVESGAQAMQKQPNFELF